MTGFDPKARREARRLAVQALYQWQVTNKNMDEIESHVLAERKTEKKVDKGYFHALVQGTAVNVELLDKKFSCYLDRLPEEVSLIELAILRLATYELYDCLDIPYRVVINEAVELGKTYGGIDSHKYINGVVDKVARELRQAEQVKQSQ